MIPALVISTRGDITTSYTERFSSFMSFCTTHRTPHDTSSTNPSLSFPGNILEPKTDFKLCQY